MNQPRVWILVGLLAILALIFFVRSNSRELPPEKNAARLDVRSGEAMADLVAKQVKGGKNIVLITHRSDADQTNGQTEQAFKQRAEKRGLTLLNTLYLDAPTRLAGSMQEQRVDAAFIQRGLSGSKIGAVDAIVSLCGEPSGRASDLESLPPFFCLCDQGTRIPELMKATIVQGAYVPRRSTPDSESKNDWFNLLYQLALPETVDALYADPKAQVHGER